jgi:hypothetical protein
MEWKEKRKKHFRRKYCKLSWTYQRYSFEVIQALPKRRKVKSTCRNCQHQVCLFCPICTATWDKCSCKQPQEEQELSD